MMNKPERDSARPPFFKNWRQLYLFVLLVQALLIFLFHLLSISYG
jgi:hypothetical protein